MLNPRLPILIRECSGVQPRLFARYGMSSWSLSYLLSVVWVYMVCRAASELMQSPLKERQKRRGTVTVTCTVRC